MNRATVGDRVHGFATSLAVESASILQDSDETFCDLHRCRCFADTCPKSIKASSARLTFRVGSSAGPSGTEYPPKWEVQCLKGVRANESCAVA